MNEGIFFYGTALFKPEDAFPGRTANTSLNQKTENETRAGDIIPMSIFKILIYEYIEYIY